MTYQGKGIKSDSLTLQGKYAEGLATLLKFPVDATKMDDLSGILKIENGGLTAEVRQGHHRNEFLIHKTVVTSFVQDEKAQTRISFHPLDQSLVALRSNIISKDADAVGVFPANRTVKIASPSETIAELRGTATAIVDMAKRANMSVAQFEQIARGIESPAQGQGVA